MKNYFFTSESVTEGHPDKLCDNIADKILNECMKQDKMSRVAVEVMAAKDTIYVAGQITTNAKIDIEKIVRNHLKEVGYDNENLDIDYRTCKVLINITKQSNDISAIVGNKGAGDQGTVFGYACNETEELMPLPIMVAKDLTNRLTYVRKNDLIKGLRPDGKTQVTVEYKDDKPVRIDYIIVSTQHLKEKNIDELRKEIYEKVILESKYSNLIDEKTKIDINKNGQFVIGGPLADTGVTGRKLMVDTYGAMAKHGGGAFSGKDLSKIDRSGAYMLRKVAKDIVQKGLADRCEIGASYAIGDENPISIYLNTYGTNKIKEEEILEVIKTEYDLSVSNLKQVCGNNSVGI